MGMGMNPMSRGRVGDEMKVEMTGIMAWAMEVAVVRLEMAVARLEMVLVRLEMGWEERGIGPLRGGMVIFDDCDGEKKDLQPI
jgi:hypothetical protein